MSRVGRLPIVIPAGVTVTTKDNVVTVKGAKGELKQEYNKAITIKVEGTEVILTRATEQKEHKALHGLYRALVANMVKGVTEGFKKNLIINGVGYKVVKQGSKVILNIGYSHPIEFDAPEGITLDVVSVTEISVSGIDRAAVGQCAANIRALRKPEPYHGYGIRYSDEVIQRKEGKTAGK